jgi:nicotinate-nucleotide adenylyltransferase
MRRIGIFGGTFNPIHNGHIKIAEEVLKALDLDNIIFIPSHIPPHKKHKKVIDAQDRYNMVKLAVKKNKKFIVSDLELNREGASYSIDTIRDLKNRFDDDDEFYFIIGSDTVPELKRWKNIKDLLKIIKFVVVNRPRYPFRDIPKSALRIQLKGIDISSSEIRKRLKIGKEIKTLVPKEVERYIKRKRLYKNEK